ncbi:MAG: hypothetical protein AMXMBFR64_59480 [Myxococcales bacterium]
MFKLNRKTEYALIAMQHIAGIEDDEPCSVTELARRCDLPANLLAKVLQELKRHGILKSTKGTNGGYAVSRDLHLVNFLEFLGIFEEQTGIVECTRRGPVTCDRYDHCNVRDPMLALNEMLMARLRNLTLQDVLHFEHRPHAAEQPLAAAPVAPAGG